MGQFFNNWDPITVGGSGWLIGNEAYNGAGAGVAGSLAYQLQTSSPVLSAPTWAVGNLVADGGAVTMASFH